MKFSPSFRYLLRDQRNAILVYYAVLASMTLLPLLVTPFISIGDGDAVSINGTTAVTTGFAFILSLCAFKESFLMNLQHGISRRSQFLTWLAAMGTICVIMAVADEAYTFLFKMLYAAFPGNFQAVSLYGMTYANSDGYTILPSIVFSFFLLLSVCSLGYLVTVFMYRLHKMGKIIFWAGAPTLFILVSSFITAHPGLRAKALTCIAEVSRLCYSTLPRMVLTCTLLTAFFSALAWLLMRRAPVK